MSSIDYYEDSSEWGNYQYVTLEDIVNNYMMSRVVDDYTATEQRFRVLHQARRAIREFYYDVLREIRAIELELSPSLQIVLPPDFVNYVRISWLDDNGLLHPMAVDNRMTLAEEYLQDNDYEILFDDEGCVLIGDSHPHNNPTTNDSSSGSYHRYGFCNKSFTPNVDRSNVFANGKYRIDKNRGIVQFTSDVQGRYIVLEYISDGLFTGCEGRPETDIRVHKFAETAVYEYIYYELIKRRRTVPYNEKRRAEREYWNSRRRTKLRINTIRKDELLQAMRGSSKWLKQ